MKKSEESLFGSSYDPHDNDDPNILNALDFKERSYDKEKSNIILDYRPEQFPGMRNSGQVQNMNGYSVAEYENRGLRLKSVAEKIARVISEHFVLYDYKGSVQTNSISAKNLLKGLLSSGALKIEGDDLHIIDDLLYFEAARPEQLRNSNFYSGLDSSLNQNEKIKAKNSVEIPDSINFREAKPSFYVSELAEALSSIIKKFPDRRGMMVGIFGKWGRGKTYLFDKIWDCLKIGSKYKKVSFSAWKYQDTKESWAYLYESILNEYLLFEDDSGFLLRKIKYYKKLWVLNLQKNQWTPLMIFVVGFFSAIYWTFFVDKITLFKTLVSSIGVFFLVKITVLYFKQRASAMGMIAKYFSKPSYESYLGFQAEIEREIENLLVAWIPEDNEEEKVILFVDDIDRCTIEKVLPIIDGLRVILENPKIHKRLIIISAIDEEVIGQAIALRYFNFGVENKNKIIKEYLEKVFIIGLKLNLLKSYEVEEFFLNVLNESRIRIKEDVVNYSFDAGVAVNVEVPIEHNQEINETFTDNFNENSPTLYDQELATINSDFELSLGEKDHLIRSVVALKHPTPRKLKIFFYKYMIFKKLFKIHLEGKSLLDIWIENGNDKVITEILLHVSNEEHKEFVFDDTIPTELRDVLSHCAKMFSPL
ncbi:P-loop NTPase fold protein [Rheinheimera hassiensis]|uniref:P-loop NTPase fold protein n=1 Tax=Rheinheimera hassiensis TaxID=1193627 RepID=UPI001F05671E|nr:P-loop NTPase fold protein [Rheinheimera hassiensis]